MNKIKCGLKLAKFRIKKNPTIFAMLMFAFFFLILCLIALEQNEIIICGILAVISFMFSVLGIKIVNKINKEWRADLNLIRQKYGLSLK